MAGTNPAVAKASRTAGVTVRCCAHLLLSKTSAGASGSKLHWQPGGKGCICSLLPCVSGNSSETVVSEGGVPQLGVLLICLCLEAVDSCLPAERSNPTGRNVPSASLSWAPILEGLPGSQGKRCWCTSVLGS